MIEKEAKKLFKTGIDLEKSGRYYEAVVLYGKATQLVPDIEYKIWSGLSDHDQNMNINDDNSRKFLKSLEDLNLANEVNLIEKFRSINLNQDGNVYFTRANDEKSKTLNLTNLPYEVIILILKWLISDQLDMQSLENFSAVCRGFYLAARDQTIWRLANLQIWGAKCIDQLSKSEANTDWRNLFITKPKANLNGVYINCTSYVRQEETCFQYTIYKPCHIVKYFRYLRFFPKGIILMLVTPDNLYQSLPKLQSQKPIHSNVIKGQYIIRGSVIYAVLKSKSNFSEDKLHYDRVSKSKTTNLIEREYRLQFAIKNTKKGKNTKLFWLHYSLIIRPCNRLETKNTFDLNSNRLPSFHYKKVKNFISYSYNPLP